MEQEPPCQGTQQEDRPKPKRHWTDADAMKMMFRSGVRVRVPTSKQLSGMGATRRMPTWYAADYFPPIGDHPRAEPLPALTPAALTERLTGSLTCPSKEVPMQTGNHRSPPSDTGDDDSTGTDAQ